MDILLNEHNLDLCHGWMANTITGDVVRVTEQGDFELTQYEIMTPTRLEFAFPKGYWYADTLQELIANNNLPLTGWVPGNNIKIL